MEIKVGSSCTSCGKCIKDCAVGVLELKDGKPSIRRGKDVLCMDCRHCVAVCPEGAISVNNVSADDCRLLSDMPIPPPDEVANLLMSRRSMRSFAPVDVPKEDIEALLDTLKYVPAGCNIRHLVFSVVSGRSKMEELRKNMISTLESHEDELSGFLKGALSVAKKNPSADPFFRGAPHLLIVKGDPKAVTPQIDCAAACAYFDILAQSHGFGVTWCGFLKIIIDAVPEVADIFSIPRGAPFYAMMFGEPMVDYVRCVNRSDGAKTEWI